MKSGGALVTLLDPWYSPKRVFQALAAALPMLPGAPTGAVTLSEHMPLPVSSAASSLSPPLGGLKSIQFQLPPPSL